MAEAIRIERDVPAPMRDSVVLRSEVWRPDDGGRHPAILVRTPYRKEKAAPLPMTDARLATARRRRDGRAARPARRRRSYPRWPRPAARASQTLAPGSELELTTTR